MRKLFVNLLFEQMQKNTDVFLLTGDLGFGLFDEIKNTLYNNFYNMGSAEQLMVAAGVGIAQSGRIPVCYSITPFVLCRPFEVIRNYLDHENCPVKLVGSGRDRDYSHDGFTHWAEDDQKITSIFSNLKTYRPETEQELVQIFPEFLYSKSPAYLNLKR